LIEVSNINVDLFHSNIKLLTGHKLSKLKNKFLLSAIAHIEAGRPIAIPTETVYGLAASISNPLAIRQIFALKGRPVNHPLIIHVCNLEMAEKYAYFTPKARKLVEHFWPGPLTIILKKKNTVPFEVTGGLDTVGIRAPNHPLSLNLIAHHGFPLAAPSANRFGEISPTSAEHIREDFSGTVPVLDGGDCSIGIESTIVDLSEGLGAIRRVGAISDDVLQAVIGNLGHTDTTAPGTLKAHYAPSTSLFLSSNVNEDTKRLRSKGLAVAVLSFSNLSDFATKLYAELRRLDKLKVDVMVVQKPSPEGIGEAILDRLTRASAGSPLKLD